MKRVQPRVIKLAETFVSPSGVREMLDEFSAQPDTVHRWANGDLSAQTLTELAGRVCYKSFEVGMNPNVTKIRLDSAEYYRNVLSKGDGSIFEHGSVTFAFLNVSRVFTHELVRHRVGVAISQESLRYVRPTELGLWLPPDTPKELDKHIEMLFRVVEKSYEEISSGVDWEKLGFNVKKQVTSLLRRILPNGMATNIIWTANHRTLRWVLEMRTDLAAEIEIRTVFDAVGHILKSDYPLIYGDFVRTENEDGTGTWKPTLRSKV